MYCEYCGKEITENADVCINCGALVKEEKILPPSGYISSFVLGILSICLPGCGFILGIIGLCLGIESKRKSSIILNSIGIAISALLIVLWFLFFYLLMQVK